MEEAISQAIERTKREEQVATSDDESSETEGTAGPDTVRQPAGSRRSLRARTRFRTHLETLLTSRDVNLVRQAMTLLEEASVGGHHRGMNSATWVKKVTALLAPFMPPPQTSHTATEPSLRKMAAAHKKKAQLLTEEIDAVEAEVAARRQS